MQVIKVSEFGGPEVLELGEADIPRPRSGEVLVRVIAAGVGPWDASFRRGGWAGSLPYVPGGEFSGVVVGDTGADAALDDGAPVYGYPGMTGCYAQSLDGAARAARDGALVATPVHAETPAGPRLRWRQYNGQPRGSRLIRMARGSTTDHCRSPCRPAITGVTPRKRTVRWSAGIPRARSSSSSMRTSRPRSGSDVRHPHGP